MRTTIIFSVLFVLLSCKENVRQLKPPFSSLIDQQTLVKTNSQFGIPVETYEIQYKSDGLKITGFISKQITKAKLPIVVLNRGGNRDFGTHSPRSLLYQQYLASEGFVVLSTQLRGNKFSEGEDEFGGADLNDILKLVEIGKSLDFAKPKVGMYGFSRGGLNAYQISRISDEVSVFAVVGAPVNPRIDFDTRPEMYDKVFKELVGDTIADRDKYDYRSPILWADEINEPILILHGSDDWRVTPQNAELMIAKLKELNHEFEYEIVEGGDHSLSDHKKLRNKKILDWFHKYLN